MELFNLARHEPKVGKEKFGKKKEKSSQSLSVSLSLPTRANGPC